MFITVVSCTGPRWIVKDKSAVDRNDYQILNSEQFLSVAGEVSPENPILSLQVLSSTTYEYAEKVLVQRTIQDYKLRPGFLILGLAGAAITIYAANSDALVRERSSTMKLTLNTTAAILAGTGLLAMKPVGEPRPTGEERYLRKIGTLVQQDTLHVENTAEQTADIAVWYGEKEVMTEQDRSINQGSLDIGLGSLLNALEIKKKTPDSVRVEIQYRDSTYRYRYPLNNILQPYARVTAPVAELRSAPGEDPENILAELLQGSQLQIVDRTQNQWYKVLYGISENYISREDAELIWRTSDFSRQNEVVTVPRIPFGNVDVENNIPILTGMNTRSLGLIVTNENYENPYPPKSYAHRDGQLIASYLENALGFEQQHIFRLRDFSHQEELFSKLQTMDSLATDSSNLIIYLSGYGNIKKQDSGYDLSYVPVRAAGDSSGPEKRVDLSELFRRIASIPSQKTVVLAEIDFTSENTGGTITDSELDLFQPLRRLSGIITDGNPDAAVLFGARPNQHSGLYVNKKGEDKKHHIFPYFFAKALQQRNTTMGAIYQYLERNISYTSRRLHDEPQDPQLYGNSSLDLVPAL